MYTLNAKPLLVCAALMAQIACSSRPTAPESPQEPKTGGERSQAEPQLSEALIQSLRGQDIILIGETHDHPQHHLYQAELIRALKPRSVAFEMLNTSQAEESASLFSKPETEWDQALTWTQRGWPDFELYRPVFEAAREVKAELIAAHPDRATLMPLMINQPLPELLIRGLKLDRPLPAAAQAELEQEIIRSHCGYAPKEMIGPMVMAQRLKDAWMARALLAAPRPVVMIVGRGHTQASRGIPWALEQLSNAEAPASWRVISLVIEGQAQPAEQPHVEVILTTPHRTDDPCERFKEQLKGMGRPPLSPDK